MKKKETLELKLREVMFNFEKEDYEKSLLALEKAGKMIISSLNTYNRKR